jgi:hypothetical protein
MKKIADRDDTVRIKNDGINNKREKIVIITLFVFFISPSNLTFILIY